MEINFSVDQFDWGWATEIENASAEPSEAARAHPGIMNVDPVLQDRHLLKEPVIMCTLNILAC